MEPKSTKAKANLGPNLLKDLLLQKHLELALDEVKREYEGLWCLPRITVDDKMGPATQENKRRRLETVNSERVPAACLEVENITVNHVLVKEDCIYFRNSEQSSLGVFLGTNNQKTITPPKSTLLQGDITQTLDVFKSSAPKFNLIVLDPPWPNRSARRKQSYTISYGTSEIRALLSSIPFYDHLVDDGLIAVWVTNKPAFREMIVGQEGLFAEWGVQLIEEWIWLKVTSKGELICAMDSTWRKPYEILLVGQRCEEILDEQVKRRVIVGVPDLHSRKPNLKTLFEGIMGNEEGRYEALEIFARNLTAGWWSWGNEVLKFQMEEHWAES